MFLVLVHAVIIRIVLAAVVKTMDSAIRLINHYPLDNSLGFATVYPVVVISPVDSVSIVWTTGAWSIACERRRISGGRLSRNRQQGMELTKRPGYPSLWNGTIFSQRPHTYGELFSQAVSSLGWIELCDRRLRIAREVNAHMLN